MGQGMGQNYRTITGVNRYHMCTRYINGQKDYLKKIENTKCNAAQWLKGPVRAYKETALACLVFVVLVFFFLSYGNKE